MVAFFWYTICWLATLCNFLTLIPLARSCVQYFSFRFPSSSISVRVALWLFSYQLCSQKVSLPCCGLNVSILFREHGTAPGMRCEFVELRLTLDVEQRGEVEL